MEYQMQNSADLLAQLNKLPSPSMVDPHNSTTTSESSLTYPNPFAEKSNNESNSTVPEDDKTIKSIMSMYPGSEPKTQEPTSWRPNSGYPSLDQRLDSWPTYQVSPKPEAKSMASPVPSPIQSRPDTADTKSSETTPNYSAPQFPSYTSPKPEVRSETPSQPNYGASTSSYQTNPTVPTTSTAPSYATTSPTTPSYQSPQSTSGYQLNSTTYQSPSQQQQQQQQASTNHVVQYPLYQQQQPYSQSSSATSVQSPQLLLSQIEKLQQLNQQQQQAFQQHLQQQLQLQKQLSTIQQTEAVTKEFIDKMQTNFTKIMGFMESVDQRLSNLEKVTQSILHNQNNPSPVVTKTSTTTPVSTMPHPPPAISYPSYAVPLGPTYSNSGNSVYPTLQTADEADAVRKIEQFEEDQKLAKRLQEELEFEAKRTSTTSSSSSKSSTSTKKPTSTPKKDDESAICPICSTQISLAEIESHADKCLESSSTTKKDSNGQPTPQEKAGFFAKLFGSKDAAATPTPAPTPVATKPTTTPAPTKPTTTTTTTTAMQQPTTVAHMPTTMPTAFQPGPGNPNGQFYQMPYMYNTAYAPYGYSQYPPPGTGQQQPGYYYYPGQQPPSAQNPKKN